MERLTYKNYLEEYEVKFKKKSDKQWSIAGSDTHIKITGEPIDKLAEFEDFMEEQGFEDLEDLERYISQSIKAGLIINKQRQENQELKERWQKLKEFIKKLSSETEVVSEDLYFIKNKMQELEKEG